MAHFIGHKQAAFVGFQPAGTFGDGGTGALTDGNDHAVCRVKHFGTRFFGQGTVLGFVQAAEHNALIGDLHRLFVEHKLHALQLGIAGLVLAGRDMPRKREALHMAHAMADGGTRHIHGRVARADDNNPVAQVVNIRVLQVIDGEVDIAVAFTLDVQGVGPPHTSADED